MHFTSLLTFLNPFKTATKTYSRGAQSVCQQKRRDLSQRVLLKEYETQKLEIEAHYELQAWQLNFIYIYVLQCVSLHSLVIYVGSTCLLGIEQKVKTSID